MLRRPLVFTLTLATLCARSSFAQDNLDPAVSGDLTLTRVVQNLGGPTSAQFLPDGRMIITQKSGEFLIAPGAGGTAVEVGSMTVPTNSERGLLDLVIDPMFAASNRLYIYYSSGNSQSVGYVTIDGSDNISAPTPLLTGLASSANHDGGGLAFGPDGLLYIGVGDTGCNCGCAPGTNDNNFYSTCLTRLHGKVLRIDRDGAIPAANPLVGVTDVPTCGANMQCGNPIDLVTTGAPRTEIYHWGFRNPWRLNFDSQTGYLWIGDVGEVTWEEVTISTQPGQHHGWPYREGLEGQARSTCTTMTPQAVGECTEPAVVFNHNEAPGSGGSITGGVFSNHCSWPTGWEGRYWFGDYTKSRIWTVEPNPARDGVTGGKTTIVRQSGGPVHFFEGPDGAVYYVSIDDGEIWRVTPTTPDNCVNPDAGTDDTGAPPEDSGVSPVDTGTPPVDTGVPQGDTGVVPADSGVTPADSGVSPGTDSGVVGENPTDEGCGCTSNGNGGLAGLGLMGTLIALSLVRRRR